MGKSAHIIGAVLLLSLVGCATADPEFGMVVQKNIVAQVVDLNPQYAGTPIEGGDGKRSVEAIKRYKNGAVKIPTNEVGGGGGSSGGGGAGLDASPTPKN